MFPMQGFVKICRYEIDVLNTMEYVVTHIQYHLNNHIDNCQKRDNLHSVVQSSASPLTARENTCVCLHLVVISLQIKCCKKY